MEIRLDATSKKPLYQQINGQIIGLIASGELPVQYRLPPIRQLAGDLGLAANTVARAYRELEVDGFVRSTGRRGTVVIRTAQSAAGASADAPSDALVRAVDDVRLNGLDGPTILALVSRAIART